MKYFLAMILLITSCGPKGDNGYNGLNGKDGTTITAQEFCPGLGGGTGFNESYLSLGGSLYAVYYDGSHTALVRLTPNNYVTTDGRNCHFTVTADSQVVY